MKIVICDDDRRLLSQIAQILRLKGHEPVLCSSAEELYRTVDGTADLLLLDVHLEEGSVFDAVRMIRLENPVPIILLSADDGDEAMITANALNCQNFISKPVTPMSLISRIEMTVRPYGLLDPVMKVENWSYIPSTGDLSSADEPEIRLQGSSRRLFYRLFKAYPKSAGKEVLRSAVSSDCTDSGLRVRISELRSQLPDRIGIVVERGIGYRLVLDSKTDSQDEDRKLQTETGKRNSPVPQTERQASNGQDASKSTTVRDRQ